MAMAMNEFLPLAASLVAGLLLGAFFFGGLWWTVRKGMSSERPALWFFGSLLLRMSTALLGFYLVGQGSWARWLACLVGFVLARLAVWRLLRVSHGARPAREASYAP
jgi:F1F0 ATPase subunit 2